MKQTILITLLVGMFLGLAIYTGMQTFSSSEPMVVAKPKPPPGQIQPVDIVNSTKQVTIVPGDIITESTPFESSQIDCSGYSVMNLIMHVENLSSTQSNHFYARATFGPIGSLTEVDVIEYNRPMPPNQSFVWSAVKPVYAQYFKVYYSMTGEGSIDINNAAVLGSGSAPNP